MILFFVAALLCLVVLWNLLIHPVQSTLDLARIFCGVFGIIFLFTALGRFWNSAYIEATGLFLGALFLLWCSNRLSQRMAG